MKKDYEVIVRTIYGDCFNKNYRILTAVPTTEFDDWEVIEAIKLIKRYNNFVGKNVAKALTELKQMGLIERIVFGRESSPVIYLGIIKNEKEIRKFLKELNADEVDYDRYTNKRIRAWWD